MTNIEETTCCGVREVDGLCRSPVDTLTQVAKEFLFDDEYGGDCASCKFGAIYDGECDHCGKVQEMSAYDPSCAHLMFTDDVSHSSKGIRLADYIRRSKLGNIVGTRRKKNPNSGNMVRAWLWTPDVDKLIKWYNKHD